MGIFSRLLWPFIWPLIAASLQEKSCDNSSLVLLLVLIVRQISHERPMIIYQANFSDQKVIPGTSLNNFFLSLFTFSLQRLFCHPQLTELSKCCLFTAKWWGISQISNFRTYRIISCKQTHSILRQKSIVHFIKIISEQQKGMGLIATKSLYSLKF